MSRPVGSLLRTLFVAIALSLLALVALWFWLQRPIVATPAPRPSYRHIVDSSGTLPVGDLPQFDRYAALILQESGIDLRLVFVRNPAGHDIDTLASQTMEALGVGTRARDERGVLLLFDADRQRMKIEVGYGLEAYFPDAFVGYLLRDHARAFFGSRDLTTGLRLLLRLLQHRIREATLGGEFDPRVLDALHALPYLSGGAGATIAVAPGAAPAPPPTATQANPPAHRTAATPADAYAGYLRMLAAPAWDSDADALTPESRAHLKQWPVSPAYRQFVLLSEFGKAYRIVERGDRAMLYFTGTPFVSPHFFLRAGDGWRLDLLPEVEHTREIVGGALTWTYVGGTDEVSQRFADLFVDVGGYTRLRDGDNRALPTSGVKTEPGR